MWEIFVVLQTIASSRVEPAFRFWGGGRLKKKKKKKLRVKFIYLFFLRVKFI
jgi:hypothetical protein